jgi:SAM-dependent methyltransferase
MNKEDLWKIYDGDYARAYDERYLLNQFSKTGSATELSVLKDVIDENTKWLDLGCGTGYFLSQFPGIQRAGLDMSPEMLKLSREVNPDALFFQEGDFRKDVPEWHGEWSLVTCMWGAYNYVDSVKELERVVAHMVGWTRSGGTIFLPVLDLEDIRPNVKIPYEYYAHIYGGPIAVTSITWSWTEDANGKLHEHLVSPPVEHFIKLLKPYFRKIEVVRYPPYMNSWVSRKAILATGRLDAPGEGHAAEVIWHPVPEPTIQAPGEALRIFRESMSPLSSKQLVMELLYRFRSGELLRALKRKIFH